jgi:hypothetical protein
LTLTRERGPGSPPVTLMTFTRRRGESAALACPTRRRLPLPSRRRRSIAPGRRGRGDGVDARGAAARIASPLGARIAHGPRIASPPLGAGSPLARSARSALAPPPAIARGSGADKKTKEASTVGVVQLSASPQRRGPDARAAGALPAPCSSAAADYAGLEASHRSA